MTLPTFGKKQLSGLIAVLSFGLTSLFAVLMLELLVPVTFIVGFFILSPLVWLLGDDFPLVESESDEETAEDPLKTLRERYAAGEIDHAEFERRLDRLLETENVDDQSADPSPTGGAGRSEREVEFEESQ